MFRKRSEENRGPACGGEDPVKIKICSLGEQLGLLPIHRVLLGHDGSMTRLLELVFCSDVKLKTIRQAVVPCPARAARLLEAVPGELVSEREIVMMRTSDGKPLLYARSYIPLSRLREEFKADLMKADVPIGKLMQRYRIEARREILKVGTVVGDKRLQSLLGQPGPFLFRAYNIITGERPLITITEFFSASLFS